jgi:DNA primase
MRLSRGFIDNVRNSADIVEIVGETVELKVYRDRSWGLCPFHNESSPSFTLRNNRFHCFGCGERGDAIRFFQMTRSVSFVNAVRQLAQRYNVPEDCDEPFVAKPRKRSFPRKRVMPDGYIAPTVPFVATFDLYASELLDSQSDLSVHDFLTRGVVPLELIEELHNALSNL